MATESLPREHHCSQLAIETDNLPPFKFIRDSSSSIDYGSRLILLQQNSPTSIQKIRSKIKPLAPQNPPPLTDKSTGSFCFEHQKDKSYICLTCNVRLCPNCSISEAKHTKHQFRRYESELKDYSRRVQKLLAFIQEKKHIVQQNKKQILSRQPQLDILQQERFSTLQANVSHFMEKHAENYSCLHEEDFHLIQHKIDCFQEKYQNYLKCLKSSSKIKIIDNTNLQEDVKSSLDGISTLEVKKQSRISKKDLIRPQYQEFHIKLHKFGENNKELVVQQLNSKSMKWKLKIYPNGYISPTSSVKMLETKYLSIFIQMLESWHEKGAFYFKIILKNQEGNGPDFERQFKSKVSIGESWGYDRFTRVSNLYKRGLVSNKDELQMTIQISWLNYNEGIASMNEGIQVRKAIIAENKRKIELLKEELKEKDEKKIKRPKIIRYVSHNNQQLLGDPQGLILLRNNSMTSQ